MTRGWRFALCAAVFSVAVSTGCNQERPSRPASFFRDRVDWIRIEWHPTDPMAKRVAVVADSGTIAEVVASMSPIDSLIVPPGQVLMCVGPQNKILFGTRRGVVAGMFAGSSLWLYQGPRTAKYTMPPAVGRLVSAQYARATPDSSGRWSGASPEEVVVVRGEAR